MEGPKPHPPETPPPSKLLLLKPKVEFLADSETASSRGTIPGCVRPKSARPKFPVQLRPTDKSQVQLRVAEDWDEAQVKGKAHHKICSADAQEEETHEACEGDLLILEVLWSQHISPHKGNLFV
jgi:hypothetical protein